MNVQDTHDHRKSSDLYKDRESDRISRGLGGESNLLLPTLLREAELLTGSSKLAVQQNLAFSGGTTLQPKPSARAGELTTEDLELFRYDAAKLAKDNFRNDTSSPDAAEINLLMERAVR